MLHDFTQSSELLTYILSLEDSVLVAFAVGSHGGELADSFCACNTIWCSPCLGHWLFTAQATEQFTCDLYIFLHSL